jgi:hypothetical protein
VAVADRDRDAARIDLGERAMAALRATVDR